MGFAEAIKHNFSHYADFSGRAQRSQYWWWFLFIWIVTVILNIVDSLLGWQVGGSTTDFTINGQVVPIVSQGYGIIASLFGLLVLIPNLAVTVRRLHDTGHSAWWLLWIFLLTFVCFVGVVVWFVFMVQKGNPSDNQYGPPPVNA